MNGAGLNGRPGRRRRRKEFAARCKRGRGWRPPAGPVEHRGKGRRASLSRRAAVDGRRGRRRPAGRAMAEGEGEVTRYITRQLARSGTPRAAQAARGRPAVSGPALPPQPRLRPSALRPPPGGSAAPPGDACPVPPLPHARRRPGGRSPSALPRTTMPRHGRLLGLAGSGAATAAAQCPRRGPGGGSREGVTLPRRGPRSPHAHGGRPCARSAAAPAPPLFWRARAPQLRPAPLPPPPARSLAPPPSLPAALAGPARAAGEPPSPPRLALTPAWCTRPVRTLLRASSAPPARRLGAPRRPAWPRPALPACHRPLGAAPPQHVTVSLAGAETSAARARLAHRAACPATPQPRDLCAFRLGRGALVASSEGALPPLQRVRTAPVPRWTPHSGRRQVRGPTMF